MPIRPILVGLSLLLLVAGPALSRDFVVNGNGDNPDAALGDGQCNAVPPGVVVPPVCTLRAAIMEANAFPGLFDTITIPANANITLIDPVPLHLNFHAAYRIDGCLK